TEDRSRARGAWCTWSISTWARTSRGRARGLPPIPRRAPVSPEAGRPSLPGRSGSVPVRHAAAAPRRGREASATESPDLPPGARRSLRPASPHAPQKSSPERRQIFAGASIAADAVLALDEAARELPSLHVAQRYVLRQRTEERYSSPDEHGHAGDDEPVDEPGAQEPLDGDAAVDVGVPDAPRRAPRADLGRLSGERLDHRALRRRGEHSRAEDEHGLLAVEPSAERQD